MADATLTHDMPAVYEPSLFGTYSKKIGMWLFLLSDSLTFGALLYAYKLAHAFSFRKHCERHHHDRVSPYQFAHHGASRACVCPCGCQSTAAVAAGHHGLRHGFRHPARQGVEQVDLRGSDSSGVSALAGE